MRLQQVRTVRAHPGVTRLDAAVPEWQFAEFHETRVHAPPERVAAAIDAVTAREIRGFLLLTWVRRPRWPWSIVPPGILAPPADRPILDVACDAGFVELARTEDELLVATLVMAPSGPVPQAPREATVEGFAALAAPGHAKAAMNFRWHDAGDGWTGLSTETRVVATDAASRRRFGAYWCVIRPGSGYLRRAWLAAVRRRAENAVPPGLVLGDG